MFFILAQAAIGIHKIKNLIATKKYNIFLHIRPTKLIIRLRQTRIENERVQASVGHVFINQHFLLSLNAATKKLYKISVLKLVNQYHFIFELI